MIWGSVYREVAQGRENTECLKEQVSALAPGELLVGSIEPASRSSCLRGRELSCSSTNTGQRFEYRSWGQLFFSVSSLHAGAKWGVAGAYSRKPSPCWDWWIPKRMWVQALRYKLKHLGSIEHLPFTMLLFSPSGLLAARPAGSEFPNQGLSSGPISESASPKHSATREFPAMVCFCMCLSLQTMSSPRAGTYLVFMPTVQHKPGLEQPLSQHLLMDWMTDGRNRWLKTL